MNKTTEALKLAEEALHNTGNALMCLTTTRKLRPMYQEMRDDAVEGCNKALAAIREALAEQIPEWVDVDDYEEPVKHEVHQEPVEIVVEVDRHGEATVVFGAWNLDVGSHTFYAAPVDAKAIRADALKENAKQIQYLKQIIFGFEQKLATRGYEIQIASLEESLKTARADALEEAAAMGEESIRIWGDVDGRMAEVVAAIRRLK